MPARALIISDEPEVVEARRQAEIQSNNRGRAREAGSQFAGKTWADLQPSDRDELLKAVAIRLGIIEPDP